METRKLSQRQEAPASHPREPSNLSLYDVALGPLKQTDKPGSVLPVFLIYKGGEKEIFTGLLQGLEEIMGLNSNT